MSFRRGRRKPMALGSFDLKKNTWRAGRKFIGQPFVSMKKVCVLLVVAVLWTLPVTARAFGGHMGGGFHGGFGHGGFNHGFARNGHFFHNNRFFFNRGFNRGFRGRFFFGGFGFPYPYYYGYPYYPYYPYPYYGY
jgi:hypothetical protein